MSEVPKIDSDGRRKLWSVSRKAWIRPYAVDAREMLANGECLPNAPGDEPAEKAAPPAGGEGGGSGEGDGDKAPAEPPKPVQFRRFGKEKLSAWFASATGKDAAEVEALSKDDLVEGLERINYVPEAE